MDDKKFEEVIRTIDTNIEPPAGLREKILNEILSQDGGIEEFRLSRLEKFFFEKPLRAACALSIAISGIFWAALGNGYVEVFLNMIESR